MKIVETARVQSRNFTIEMRGSGIMAKGQRVTLHERTTRLRSRIKVVPKIYWVAEAAGLLASIVVFAVLAIAMPHRWIFTIIAFVVAALLLWFVTYNVRGVWGKAKEHTPTAQQLSITVYDSQVSDRVLHRILTEFWPDTETGEMNVKLLTVTRKAVSILVIRLIAVAVPTLAALVGAVWLVFHPVHTQVISFSWPWWIVLIPLCLGGLVGAKVWFDWMSQHFAVADRQAWLIRKYPPIIWWRDEKAKNINIKDLTTIDSEFPRWARIIRVNVGNLDLDSSGQNDTSFNNINGYPRPVELRETVRQALNTLDAARERNATPPTRPSVRTAFNSHQ